MLGEVPVELDGIAHLSRRACYIDGYINVRGPCARNAIDAALLSMSQYGEYKQRPGGRVRVKEMASLAGTSRIQLRAGMLAVVLFLGLSSAPTTAQESPLEPEQRISPLNPIDREYMASQRQRITELTLRYYGGLCCRSEAELIYLQRLLDDGRVGREEREALQAMGVLLGDLLASELDLDWVVYEDAKGRSRALRLGNTENYLFPITMISRRREAGDTTPVTEVYAAAVAAMETARPPLPFEEPRE